ncbi:MAG: (Fe-S)-binding protein [Promethearchaeota archaeon]
MAKTGMERLEELRKDIFKCIHCKACRFAYSGEPDRKGIGEHVGKQGTVLYEGMVDACPAGIEYGWEAFWNAGKIWIARSILNEDLEFSEEVRDVIMPCITCGQCSAQCENKVRTVDIIESLRAACVEAGVPMIEKHELVKKLTMERNNPYGGAADERLKWAKDAGLEKYIDNKEAKVGYYVGCTASYRQMEIAVATCKIFEQLGINFTLISDEVCCGSPFFRVGAVDIAQELMNKNLKAFKDFDLIFFSCAGCFKTFSNDYPKWMAEESLPFKTMHAFELVSRLITSEKIKFKPNKQLKGKVVTYHDPCHLGRHMALEIEQSIIEESKNLMMDSRKIRQMIAEWYEIPRIILKQLEQDVGIVFKEMYRIKLDSFCCGAGGGVRAGYPDFSLKTSSLRLDEANAVGADIVTTECPFCYRNLYDANELYNHNVEVYGLIQLIDSFKLLDIQEKPTFEEILDMKS